jgi:RNA-directed DNA polymerase
MNGPEKSDSPIVAVKPANEAARAAEEHVEPRGGTKENADQQTTVRTQSREVVSHAQARIREAVTRNRAQPLTTLLHHVSVDVLRAGFFGLKKNAVPGVDGLTWTQYEDGLEANLQSLHARVHGGGYRALASRRRYSEGGWAASTAGHCRAGGQDCPSGGGGDPDAYLRDGVPGIQLRFPA